MSKIALTFVFVIIILVLTACEKEPEKLRQGYPLAELRGAPWCYYSSTPNRHRHSLVSVFADSNGGLWVKECRNSDGSVTFRRIR